MTTAPRPGEVYLWGASTEGQPTAVPSSREQVVAGISAGSSGCALASSGAKATWLLVDDAAPAASADERAAGGLEAASAAAAVGAAAFGGGVGAGHALLLSSTGAIFTWGLGDQGQLGLGAKAAGGGASGALRLVQGNLASKRAVAVAAGTAHSVALTEAGDVYAFGRGFEGQLGIDPKSAPQMPLVSCDPAGPFPPPPMGALALVPRLCPAFIKAPVAAVACGARFSVCVTRAGAVFSWGEGQCGQLGVGRVTQARAPTLVLKASASGSPIAAVACGWAHCLAASQAGELYSWGLDHNGQLGLGDGAKARATPTLVTAADDGSLLPAVSSVAACGHHSALVAGDAGSVYTFGCGADGRLGHGAGEAPTKPRAVASLRGLIVQDVACTPKHTLAFVPTRVVALEPPLVREERGRCCSTAAAAATAARLPPTCYHCSHTTATDSPTHPASLRYRPRAPSSSRCAGAGSGTRTRSSCASSPRAGPRPSGPRGRPSGSTAARRRSCASRRRGRTWARPPSSLR